MFWLWPTWPRQWGRRCSSSMWLGCDRRWLIFGCTPRCMLWMIIIQYIYIYINRTTILMQTYVYIYTYTYTDTYTFMYIYIYYIQDTDMYGNPVLKQPVFHGMNNITYYPICRWSERVRWLGIGKPWENRATIVYRNYRYKTCQDRETKDMTMNSWENHWDIATPKRIKHLKKQRFC